MSGRQRRINNHRPLKSGLPEPLVSRAPAVGASPFWLIIGLAMLVGAAVTVTHWPVLSVQTVSFDDPQFLFSNPVLMNPSSSNAVRVLTDVLKSRVRGYYEGLTLVSLMGDVALGGTRENLYPFHRTNLVLHVLNVMLLIVLLQLLFGKPWIAAAAALLFGLHPMTVEPVAWVWERKTLLATTLVLGCMIFYVLHTRRGGLLRYMVSIGLFVLALMAKPTVTPVPILLVLLDYWPLRRAVGATRQMLVGLALEKIPYLLIGIAAGVITIISTSNNAPVSMPSSLPATLLKICYLTFFYLGKILWPLHLSSVYLLPSPIRLTTPVYLVCVLGMIALAVALVRLWRCAPALAIGLGFFLIAISPTLGIVQYSWVIASDKYAYFPALGILLIVCWLLAIFTAQSKDARPAPPIEIISSKNRDGTAVTRCPPFARSIVLVAAILAIAALEARATRRYLAEWQTTERFFRYMLTLAPNADALHSELGCYLMEQGRKEEALHEHAEALRLNPGSVPALTNLGVHYYERGELEKAIEHLRTAVEADPAEPEVRMNLGLALLKHGDLEAAGEQFATVIDQDPDWPQARANFGDVLLSLNYPDQAVEQYRVALAMNPGLGVTHRKLGQALVALSQPEEGLAEFQESLRLAPVAETYTALGDALKKLNRTAEANRAYEAALRLTPDEPTRQQLLDRLKAAATSTAASQ